MKKIIFSKSAPAPIGPYSQAVEYNGMLYLSGQIAIDPDSGELRMESLKEEMSQVMLNIKNVLAEEGLGFDHILKTSIFLRNMDDFKEINDIYSTYFTADFPARETVEVSRLPKDVNVEISVLAAKF